MILIALYIHFTIAGDNGVCFRHVRDRSWKIKEVGSESGRNLEVTEQGGCAGEEGRK
jgi:hypothetical protein